MTAVSGGSGKKIRHNAKNLAITGSAARVLFRRRQVNGEGKGDVRGRGGAPGKGGLPPGCGWVYTGKQKRLLSGFQLLLELGNPLGRKLSSLADKFGSHAFFEQVQGNFYFAFFQTFLLALLYAE